MGESRETQPEAATIECYTCGAHVRLARSVLIRQEIGPIVGQSGPVRQTFAAGILATRQHGWPLSYGSQTRSRREFICLPCYACLDNEDGVGFIVREGRISEFELLPSSRAGKAPTCDYGKYRSRRGGPPGA
jgi:hypothetical protein